MNAVNCTRVGRACTGGINALGSVDRCCVTELDPLSAHVAAVRIVALHCHGGERQKEGAAAVRIQLVTHGAIGADQATPVVRERAALVASPQPRHCLADRCHWSSPEGDLTVWVTKRRVPPHQRLVW